jgi:undecaprenyl diphosphate synthase
MSEAQEQVDALGPERLPRHVAVVMDGNGRWAAGQGKPRNFGHARGAEAVLPIVRECARLNMAALTMYALSSENLLRRPAEEVGALMELYELHLREERQEMVDGNIRFIHVGRREGVAPAVLRELDQTIEATRGNDGLRLCLALNYGSRQEIAEAARALAREAAVGSLDPEAVDEQAVAGRLYTADVPDPDLLIRTAGEMRLSNFLLWQLSYAEIWVTPTLWPDFDPAELHRGLLQYAGRTRRFGAVVR